MVCYDCDRCLITNVLLGPVSIACGWLFACSVIAIFIYLSINSGVFDSTIS